MRKKQTLIYVVIVTWAYFFILNFVNGFEIEFKSLAAYFSSLTAYVASYIWSESKRQSNDNVSLLFKGSFSHRELLIYVVLGLWLILGHVAFYTNISLIQLSIYFSALTGFVGSFIAGETYKPEKYTKKSPS